LYVSEARGREIFEPFMVRMALAMDRGDADLRDSANLSPLLRSRTGKRALANLRYDAIMWHMRSLINSDTDPDVRWDISSGIQLLLVGDIAVCRFKRIDQEYLSRNYPTLQAQAFQDQDDDLPLEGMPPKAARFTAGWQTDSFEQAIQGRYLLQPNKGFRPIWVISLDEMAGQGLIPMPRPQTPSGPRPDRIQPKGPGRKDAKVDQS
jgi:hypothetical protein